MNSTANSHDQQLPWLNEEIGSESGKHSKDVKINLPESQPAAQPSADMKLLGVNLNFLSRSAQFVTLCGGVFFFYLIYGYFQVGNHDIIQCSISTIFCG